MVFHWSIIIIIIITFIPRTRFSHRLLLMVFHWNLWSSELPLLPRTVHSILVDFNVTAVWMVSIRPPSLLGAVSMYRRYFQCWENFFFLLFMTHKICLCLLWDVMADAFSVVFFFFFYEFSFIVWISKLFKFF